MLVVFGAKGRGAHKEFDANEVHKGGKFGATYAHNKRKFGAIEAR